MEITSFNSYLLLLASLLLSLFLINKFRFKKARPNLPPGPRKIPIIGNFHNLIGAVPHRALHRLSLKYGPLMHLQLGEFSAVIVSSPDGAKQVMKTHDVNFASRPSILAAEIISYGCTSITFAPYGDYWRQLRKICTLELLSVKRVVSLRSIRENVFMDLMRSMAANEGSSINLTAKLYSSSYSIVSIAAMGKITKDKETMLAILQEAIEVAAGFDVADLFPSKKLLMKFNPMTRKLKKLHVEADRILDDVLTEHREEEEAAAKANTGDVVDGEKHLEDLVDVLHKFQDEGLELPLTTNNIKAVLLDVLGAGSETSATTVDWAMAEMLKNPGILLKAQYEVRELFDDRGIVDEALIPQLTYLKSIIKETLRMHPALPLLLPRKCGHTCKIDGYEIPHDTKIIVNAWAINRDPNYWKDADLFQPERFLDSTMDYRGNNFEYIPFGAGRRICPGMSFGLANTELPLAMLLYYFDWELSGGRKGEEMNMDDSTGVTTRRKEDLDVIPKVKRPLRA